MPFLYRITSLEVFEKKKSILLHDFYTFFYTFCLLYMYRIAKNQTLTINKFIKQSFLRNNTSSFNFHDKSFCVVKDSKIHPKFSEMIRTRFWNGTNQYTTGLDTLNAKSVLDYLILTVQVLHNFYDQLFHVSFSIKYAFTNYFWNSWVFSFNSSIFLLILSSYSVIYGKPV